MTMAPSELPSDRASSTLAPQDPRGRPKMPPLSSYSTGSVLTQSKMKRAANSGSGAGTGPGNSADAGSSGPGTGSGSGTAQNSATGAAIGSKISHGRSLSHISTSSKASAHGSRPHLARSKSSDGVGSKSGKPLAGMAGGLGLKRSNRSFTKITGLQPLTKSTSNQSIKSNKSNSSLKGLNSNTINKLKSSSKKEKAILRLNDDDDDEYEDTGSPPEEVSAAAAGGVGAGLGSQAGGLKDASGASGAAGATAGATGGTSGHIQPSNGYSFQSSDDLSSQNIYGGSLLLSQSTGLTKKINEMSAGGMQPHQVHQGGTAAAAGGASASIGSNNSENISGISFKANPMDSASKAAIPITTTKTVETKNSYQPNQTIFNNLQRRGTKSTNTPLNTTNVYDATSNTNNFSTFLKTNNSSAAAGPAGGPSGLPGGDSGAGGGAHPGTSHHDNRTQQRLWLQRENSLMDVPTLDPTKLANFSSLSLNNLMFSHQGGHAGDASAGNGNNGSISGASGAAGAGGGPGAAGVLPSPGAVVTPGAGGVGPSDSTSSLYGLLLNIQTSHQSSIQSRTEFERLNREYLNVRRNLNPVAETLSRTQDYFKLNSNINAKVAKTRSKPPPRESSPSSASSLAAPASTSNTFKEYSPEFQEKEAEIASMVNKIWQTALITSSPSASSSQTTLTSPLRAAPQHQGYQQQQLNHYHLQQQQQQQQSQHQGQQSSQQSSSSSGQYRQQGAQPALQQLAQQGINQNSVRPTNQRLQSYTQSNYNNLRSSQTPTTRAVKLAASQQSFKKNDHSVNLA